MKQSTFILIFAALFFGIQTLADDTVVDGLNESDEDVRLDKPVSRVSYGIALGLGRNLASDGFELDIDAFALGLSDAMSGAEQRMTPDEIKAEVKAYQEQLKNRKKAER